MPAGASVWMVHDSNSCWDHVPGSTAMPCATSDQFGASGGIPMQTYSYSTSWATSFAQAYPDSLHTYLKGWGAGFMYVSMHDTYTVHSAAAGAFEITAHLVSEGVANSIWSSVDSKYWLYGPLATVEIGTFSPSTANPFMEQFRITPFRAGFPDETAATWDGGITIGGYVSKTFEVSTSYTKTVQSGDIFELGYGVNTYLHVGELDLRNTARVSFDLPEGVWLTSQNGVVFGTPVPEPSSALLLAFGMLGVLVAWQRRLKASGLDGSAFDTTNFSPNHGKAESGRAGSQRLRPRHGVISMQESEVDEEDPNPEIELESSARGSIRLCRGRTAAGRGGAGRARRPRPERRCGHGCVLRHRPGQHLAAQRQRERVDGLGHRRCLGRRFQLRQLRRLAAADE